jgi:hypothetical protein
MINPLTTKDNFDCRRHAAFANEANFADVYEDCCRLSYFLQQENDFKAGAYATLVGAVKDNDVNLTGD